MPALYFIELVVALLIGMFVVTQVVVPLVLREPLFPMFRKGETLRRTLEEKQEDVRDANVEREIDAAERAARWTRESLNKEGEK